VGAAVAVAIVAVAVVKPWGSTTPTGQSQAPSPSPGTLARPPLIDVGPIASLAPETPRQMAARHCHNTTAWRVFSYQRRGDRILNVWTAAEPVAARGADPVALTFTPIFADQLMGFGYCAPSADELQPDEDDVVTIWRVGPDGRSTKPVPAVSIAPELRADFGALMGPGAPSPAPERQAWAPGKYLIQVGGAVLGAEVVLFRQSA
jgi:hypothetical protein